MRIPVIILSGFLGSGKTTLLLRLLAEARQRGWKPGVLMNELGKRDVDGLILQHGQELTIERLLDGCVCCAKKEEMADKLTELLRDQPDVLFIELSGVANPEEVALSLAHPALLRSVKLQRIVTVLDAEHVLDYNSWFQSDQQLVRTLRRQIETADLLVLNKIDLIPASKQLKIEKIIRKQNQTAPILQAINSEIELELLLAGLGREAASSEAAAAPRPLRGSGISSLRKPAAAAASASVVPASANDNASFSRVATLSFDIPQHVGLAARQIDQFLLARKDVLLRAKGYFRFPPQQVPYLLQYAGKRPTWEPSPEYTGESYLVLIGLDWEEDSLIADWELLMSRSDLPRA